MIVIIKTIKNRMPKVTSPEAIARIKVLAAAGKSTRAIAEELGLGKSSVARYAKDAAVVEPVNNIPEPPIEITPMSINDNAARAFLSDIGIKAPATSLRNEIVPVNSPLKNNPRAVMLAESLLGESIRPRAPIQVPEPGVRFLPQAEPHAESAVLVEAPPEKHTLITQIHLNIENFAPLLKNITSGDPEGFKLSLYNKSDSELMTLLRVIERTRLVGNLTNQFKHMFWMSTSALEMGTQLLGLKSQGLTEALRIQDEEIKMVLKELAMAKADSFSNAQRPEVRLAFLVSTTLLSVDAMNRAREHRSGRRTTKAPEAEAPATEVPEPQTKFADL